MNYPSTSLSTGLKGLSVEAIRQVPPGQSFSCRVAGASMEPALQAGDEVVAERSGTARRLARLGDLVVLDLPDAGLVVHRLLWRAPVAVRTRGDGSGRMDPPVARQDVLGRVVSVVRAGRDITPGPMARHLAWMRYFAGAAWHRLGRRLSALRTAGATQQR